MRLLRRFTSIVVIIVLVIALVLFDAFGWLGPLKSAVGFVSRPVQTQLYRLGLRIGGVNPAADIDASAVLQENRKLHDDINNLIVENTRLRNQLEQTGILQEQLAFIQEQNFLALPMHVIGRSSDPASQGILGDKGSSDGLGIGVPVVVSGGIFIGKVSDVTSETAQVRLASDSNTRLSALIQNDTQSPGLLRGEHGLALRMELIPQLEDVKEGQVVITSGDEDFIPKGLVIGKVETVDKPQGELFQQASVEPLVDFHKLEIITAILPHQL